MSSKTRTLANAARQPFAIGALAGATLLAAVAMTASPALALPNNGATCHVTIYFNDASHDVEVGWFSTCPDGDPPLGMTGRRTRFQQVNDVQQGHYGPKQSPMGPIRLPCDFSQRGCGNLPAQR